MTGAEQIEKAQRILSGAMAKVLTRLDEEPFEQDGEDREHFAMLYGKCTVVWDLHSKLISLFEEDEI